uniref:Putative secreted protein n=1 Tax=Ixodes ricinus TaxID=34613 RepID=A0A6B0TUF8_IXORI
MQNAWLMMCVLCMFVKTLVNANTMKKKMPSVFNDGHLCTLPILDWRNVYAVASFCAQLAVTSEEKKNVLYIPCTHL